MRNVPDDWDHWWTFCEVCGARYHQSEGYCCDVEEEEEDDDDE